MEQVQEKKATRVALYCRVSTLLGQDPENQLVHLRKFAVDRSYKVVDEFTDRGVSGNRERRPALDEMIRRAKAGDFKIIMVTALDRLGRNTKHMLNLIDQLKEYDVTITSLREGIKFDSPMGQMMLTVISAIAQLERSLISERIRNALAAKALAAKQTGNGWRCGRPTVLNDEIAELIQVLRSQGKSIRAIAKEVGIGKTSVLRILKSGPKR
jgi:DNA invertase Pin-like site-specific DNA recombinase